MRKLLLILSFSLLAFQTKAQTMAYPSTNHSKVFGASCADLHYVDPVVIGHQLNVTVTYFETFNNAQNGTNSLERFYEPLSDPQTIYARVENNADGMFAIAESIIDTASPPSGPPPGISSYYFEICDSDNNGIEMVYLDNLRALYEGYAFPTTSFCGSQDSEVTTTYYLTESDAINETNQLNPIYTLTGTQNFFRKIKNMNTGEFLIDDMINVSVVTCVTDTDMDGIPDLAEDANRNLILDDDDTDQDGLKNFEDDDDDGDGILTINEDYNNNGDPTDDDTNGNSIPDYLESMVTLSLNEGQFAQIKLYPNPVSDVLYFESNGNESLIDVSIINILGKTILTKRNFDLNEPINVSVLSSGIYVVQLRTDKSTRILKFIKI